MVKIIKVFEPEGKDGKDDLFKSVKDFGEKIEEYPNTSTFITINDALASGAKIFLIKGEKKEDTEIQRDFVEA